MEQQRFGTVFGVMLGICVLATAARAAASGEPYSGYGSVDQTCVSAQFLDTPVAAGTGCSVQIWYDDFRRRRRANLKALAPAKRVYYWLERAPVGSSYTSPQWRKVGSSHLFDLNRVPETVRFRVEETFEYRIAISNWGRPDYPEIIFNLGPVYVE